MTNLKQLQLKPLSDISLLIKNVVTAVNLSDFLYHCNILFQQLASKLKALNNSKKSEQVTKIVENNIKTS